MLIGLKLDIGFSQSRDYKKLYCKRDVLAFLRELGVQAVETPVGPETGTDELREHIRTCVDTGLKVSLHPYSEATECNPAFFSTDAANPCRQMHERFFSLAAEAARLQQFPTVVNLHAAAGTTDESRQELLEQSMAFFTWAGDWCRRNAPEVAVAVELQISPSRREERVRIGDNYEELLTIVEHSGVMACWDFGHAYQNTRRYGGSLYPPEALAKRIGHVHCHDAHGDDHQPLIYGEVPWRDFLKFLTGAGFDGRVILEVPPSEFRRAGGIDTLATSLAVLRAHIATLL